MILELFFVEFAADVVFLLIVVILG